MFRLVTVFVIIFNIIISNQETWGAALDVTGTRNVGISGGYSIAIENAPFMAAVLYKSIKYKKYTMLCGGSIIHERFILTAAHCFCKINRLPALRVTVGTSDQNETQQALHRIQKRICHEGFTNFFHNDICVLKLTRPVEFGPKVAKVGLPNANFRLPPGTDVNVTGWGATKSTDETWSKELRQATIPIVSEDICRNDHINLSNREICAGAKGHDACKGDSGGPLTYKNIQIGIVSYGESCSSYSNGVGVYTSVASYLYWIKDAIDLD